MKNLGCTATIVVVNLEFIMVQMYLNASDYSLKFDMLEVPKLPYIAISLITLNL